MAKKMSQRLNRTEKAAMVIDGKDYWNVKWEHDRGSFSNAHGVPLCYILVKSTSEVEEKREKRGVILTWTFFIISVILLMGLGEFITVNIADAIWHSKDAEQLSSILTAVPLFLGTSFLMSCAIDYLEEEKDFFRMEKGNVDETFTVPGVTLEQADDIVTELKRLRGEGEVRSYMEIVKKMRAKQQELDNEREKEFSKRKMKAEALEAEKRALRSRTNPFLNSVEMANHSLELTGELERLNGEEKMLNTEDLRKSLREIEKNRANGVTFDKKSYDDCSRELLQVTRKYNETLDSGIRLSDEELKNYQSLVDACSLVLKRVGEGVIEERSVDARVSDIFIRDKYHIPAK